jgi:hypothetical protein
MCLRTLAVTAAEGADSCAIAAPMYRQRSDSGSSASTALMTWVKCVDSTTTAAPQQRDSSGGASSFAHRLNDAFCSQVSSILCLKVPQCRSGQTKRSLKLLSLPQDLQLCLRTLAVLCPQAE